MYVRLQKEENTGGGGCDILERRKQETAGNPAWLCPSVCVTRRTANGILNGIDIDKNARSV